MIAKKLISFLIFLFLISSVSALTTFTITEGEAIKINLSAADQDQDNIHYYFSPPLNNSGAWQTTLDDAGTYHTKVVVSDGKSQTEEELVLIVKNKNQPPQIAEQTIVVDEGEMINLTPLVSDPDHDPLKLTFQKPFDDQGLWIPGHQDAGLYTTKITVSDLEFRVTKEIPLEIKDKNFPPQLTSTFSEEKLVLLEENTTIHFSVDALDYEDDSLTYLWLLDNEKISTESSFDYYFDFDSPLESKLEVVVSDQSSETRKIWALKIKNINRPPQINLPEIIVNEGEKIVLQLPTADLDGQLINYTFYPPFQNNTWQTDYEDAGEYSVLLTASDGESTTTHKLKITILDVDCAPLITLENQLELDEGEKLKLDLEDYLSDPDGDDLDIYISGLPEDALFLEDQLRWTPSYDFVQRKTNFISNLFNRLRWDRRFSSQHKDVQLFISACDQELCTNHTLTLRVHNNNQAPYLDLPDELVITETDLAVLSPSVSDPDGDYVEVTFAPPFDNQGTWQTDYDDQNQFFTTITASDGFLETTKEVSILILNNNRPPTLETTKDYFKLNEGEEFSLPVSVFDPDQDNLNLSVENLPPGASFQNQVFSWTPSSETVTERDPTFWNNFYAKFESLNRRYSTELNHITINFVVSDGEFYVYHPVVITVKNVNRAPTLVNATPGQYLIVPFGQEVVFRANFADADQDNLTYHWSFGLWEKSFDSTSNALKRKFTTPGIKTVKVTASDGSYEAEHEWKIKVNPPQKKTNNTKS